MAEERFPRSKDIATFYKLLSAFENLKWADVLKNVRHY